MRALITSLIVLILLASCWFVFHQYSDTRLREIVSVCEEEVMPAIESEHWGQAEARFQAQYQAWHIYKKRALLMLETDRLTDLDFAFAKTLMYIKAKDVSNSSGELLALQEALKRLYENEELSLANIL